MAKSKKKMFYVCISNCKDEKGFSFVTSTNNRSANWDFEVPALEFDEANARYVAVGLALNCNRATFVTPTDLCFYEPTNHEAKEDE